MHASRTATVTAHVNVTATVDQQLYICTTNAYVNIYYIYIT
jgi:hypothetical protein